MKLPQSLILFLSITQIVATIDNAIYYNNEDDDGVLERIMYGSRAPFNKYPWFAEGIGCGAALIAPEFIITAEHCNIDRFRRVKISAVCTGQLNEDRGYDNCGAPFEERYRKRVFELNEQNGLHIDLRLIQLDKRAQATPVGIDDGSLVKKYAAGKGNLWTPGFGQSQHGYSTDYLMEVSGKYVPLGECHKRTKDQDDIDDITNGMICVQNDDTRKQACYGDSGGPLYDWSANKIIGVVSTGNSSCEGYPVIYTSIGKHYDWVKNTICTHHSDPKPSMCYDSSAIVPAPVPSPVAAPTTINDKAPSTPISSAPQYFQIKSEFNNGYEWCLSSAPGNDIVGVEVCNLNDSRQLWRTTRKGQLKSKFNPSKCMINRQAMNILKLEDCRDVVEFVFVYDTFFKSLLWVKNMSDFGQFGLRALTIMKTNPQPGNGSSKRVYVKLRKGKPRQSWNLVYLDNGI
ncbi:hypothetical protein CTEN210_05935 [Chaetoceros tenuissimus]|uniref:Peptidase S1 domain-containing protein n=1 Tax=Chaetoceros tenuissimus TaxID=426638 RepID=A0AAD3H4C4_9STRA|nr:hypothetical protein CTEN210_05935 [Chaetoceros tenuissimus]